MTDDSYSLIRGGDHWTLEVRDRKLEASWTGFELVFDSGAVQFRIASPFEFGGAVQQVEALSGEQVQARFSRRQLGLAKLADSGSLTLTFSDGETLSVAADPAYEAWTFYAEEGVRAVSLPAGGLATWGFDQRS